MKRWLNHMINPLHITCKLARIPGISLNCARSMSLIYQRVLWDKFIKDKLKPGSKIMLEVGHVNEGCKNGPIGLYHEYRKKKCFVCQAEFCFSCCGWSSTQQGTSQEDVMACPVCRTEIDEE